MFVVTKQEAAEIRKHFPDYPVTRTCRQHGRASTWYAAETRGIIQLVEKMRHSKVILNWDGTDKFDGHNTQD